MAAVVLAAGAQEGMVCAARDCVAPPARAEELGMTYREYTLEILERGRYL
jgi:hypothetical protein